MLFEVAIVCFVAILLAYTLAIPLMVVKSIMLGVKLAEKPQETADKPVFTMPKIRKKPKKKPKMTKEDQRNVAIMANIDAYDGTSNGQREIR